METVSRHKSLFSLILFLLIINFLTLQQYLGPNLSFILEVNESHPEARTSIAFVRGSSTSFECGYLGTLLCTSTSSISDAPLVLLFFAHYCSDLGNTNSPSARALSADSSQEATNYCPTTDLAN